MRLGQLVFESETWKRLLSFMMEENIQLKNRLSFITKNIAAIECIEQMEIYSGRFIKADERLMFLRNEIAEIDQLLAKEILNDEAIAEINSRLKQVSINVIGTEINLNQLKLDFNNYLKEILEETSASIILK